MLTFELVVPAFNEAENLPDIVLRTQDACVQAGFTSAQFQLVIVNNGSEDKSSEVLRSLKSTPSGAFFRIVTLPKNQGYGGGIHAGLISTTAPYVGWTHADRQCDPLDAFRALAIVRGRTDETLVKGHRRQRNWKDQFVTTCFELCARVFLGIKVRELNAQPKVFHRSLLQFIQRPPTGIAFDLYVLFTALRNRWVIESIPVDFAPRVAGTSKWASHFMSRYKTIFRVLKDILRISLQDGRV